MPVGVVIVRHGERLDEVDGKEWRRIQTHETKHDPPLTAAGWEQAKCVGGKLTALLQNGEACMTIYSSPTARTLSTAASIVLSLPSGEAVAVTPAYSLNCCAAANHYGVAKGFPQGEPHEDVMRGVPLTCWPPLGNAEEVDRRQTRRSSNFSEAVKELAANHSDGDLIVIVTHREGIWDVLKSVGAKMKSGYCNSTFLSYDKSCQALAVWDPASDRLASGACRVESGNVPGYRDSAHSVVETIETVLSQGSGTVVVHRGGRGGSGSLLWRTPGVRGTWAEGGAIADGEAVTLLSSPVSSEGNEGDFVLVRRASGIEGWTKIKNVRLVS